MIFTLKAVFSFTLSVVVVLPVGVVFKMFAEFKRSEALNSEPRLRQSSLNTQHYCSALLLIKKAQLNPGQDAGKEK